MLSLEKYTGKTAKTFAADIQTSRLFTPGL